MLDFEEGRVQSVGVNLLLGLDVESLLFRLLLAKVDFIEDLFGVHVENGRLTFAFGVPNIEQTYLIRAIVAESLLVLALLDLFVDVVHHFVREVVADDSWTARDADAAHEYIYLYSQFGSVNCFSYICSCCRKTRSWASRYLCTRGWYFR